MPIKGTYYHSEKTKKKIGEANRISLKGKHCSPRTEFKKGHKMSIETRKKISLSEKGKILSEDVREKISKAHKGMKKPWAKPPHPKGKRHPYWRGGNSPEYRIKTAPRPKPDQCEVCGAFGSDTKRGLGYDHDHKTGKFRGWLCTRCNCALGMVKENTETLMALIEYIKKHKKSTNKRENIAPRSTT